MQGDFESPKDFSQKLKDLNLEAPIVVPAQGLAKQKMVASSPTTYKESFPWTTEHCGSEVLLQQSKAMQAQCGKQRKMVNTSSDSKTQSEIQNDSRNNVINVMKDSVSGTASELNVKLDIGSKNQKPSIPDKTNALLKLQQLDNQKMGRNSDIAKTPTRENSMDQVDSKSDCQTQESNDNKNLKVFTRSNSREILDNGLPKNKVFSRSNSKENEELELAKNKVFSRSNSRENGELLPKKKTNGISRSNSKENGESDIAAPYRQPTGILPGMSEPKAANKQKTYATSSENRSSSLSVASNRGSPFVYGSDSF